MPRVKLNGNAAKPPLTPQQELVKSAVVLAMARMIPARLKAGEVDDGKRKPSGASALGHALGVKPQNVMNWRARGNVPPEFCVAIERLTGVKVWKLNPTVFPRNRFGGKAA
jgi:hypothetical protein